LESKITASNGVRIYSYPNNSLHSFCISAYIKCGCIYESEEDNGISHMFEHMVFRSINRSYDGNLYQILDKYGLTFNASTYREFVHFYINGATHNFDLAAEIIAKILQPIIIDNLDFNIEKKRIKAEIHEEDYRTSLECFSNNVVWEGTPQVRSICGQCSNIDKISFKKLIEFQKNVVNSDNLFFYVTGNVSEEETLNLMRKIEKFPVNKGIVYNNVVSIPNNFGNRIGDIYLKNCSYSMVRISFDINTSRYSDAAMELFFDILFSGDSCIMFQSLSEKSGLIYGYDARFAKYNNIGNIYFSYEVKTNKVEQTIQVVVDCLKQLKSGIGDKLDYVKAPYIDNAMILFDNPEEFNWNRAYENHILNCEYTDIESRIKAFSDVKNTDIELIANEVLQPKNLVVAMKSNKKKIDLDKIRSIVREL